MGSFGQRILCSCRDTQNITLYTAMSSGRLRCGPQVAAEGKIVKRLRTHFEPLSYCSCFLYIIYGVQWRFFEFICITCHESSQIFHGSPHNIGCWTPRLFLIFPEAILFYHRQRTPRYLVSRKLNYSNHEGLIALNSGRDLSEGKGNSLVIGYHLSIEWSCIHVYNHACTHSRTSSQPNVTV